MDAAEKESLLEQLRQVDNQLSPEWLTCDGELPAYMVRRRAAQLNRQRRGIIAQLGYEPTFAELYPKLTAAV
jgi:hypothetical protein